MITRRRLLFTAAGGHGHLQPLLPLAELAFAAGHEVLVTGAASLAPHVTRRGLAYTATGPDVTPIYAPLVVHELDAERRAVGTSIARTGRARAIDVLALCRSWQPDLVIRDEADVGAAVAAEAVGIPHVVVVVLGAGSFLVPEIVRAPLDALRAEFGLPDQDSVAMLHRYLTLTPFPTAFRDPADPLVGEVVGYRHDVRTSSTGSPKARRVYVTLGTIFNTESGDLLRTAALAAIACPGVDAVLVATGEHIDPASLGPMPLAASVHRFVRQDEALATCCAVVSHAGSGTVLGALKRALPMVCLPLGADQHLNARRVDALGLGVTLRADEATEDDMRIALRHVLDSTLIRRNGEALRDDIQALPDLHDALRAVEALIQ